MCKVEWKNLNDKVRKGCANIYTKSRFITVDDKKADFFVYKLPATWWSRPYEYE
jgi:hypothetical protein